MKVTKKAYTPEDVQYLYKVIENHSHKGEGVDYDIHVDDILVVKRTNDPRHYFDFEDFVNDSTKQVMVRLYLGKSRINKKHIFEFQPQVEEEFHPDTLKELEEAIEILVEKEELQRKVTALEEEREEHLGKIQRLQEENKAINEFSKVMLKVFVLDGKDHTIQPKNAVRLIDAVLDEVFDKSISKKDRKGLERVFKLFNEMAQNFPFPSTKSNQ